MTRERLSCGRTGERGKNAGSDAARRSGCAMFLLLTFSHERSVALCRRVLWLHLTRSISGRSFMVHSTCGPSTLSRPSLYTCVMSTAHVMLYHDASFTFDSPQSFEQARVIGDGLNWWMEHRTVSRIRDVIMHRLWDAEARAA